MTEWSRSGKDDKIMEHISETKELLETDVLDAPIKDVKWDINDASAESDTKLEYDTGHGGAAIIRRFVFAANPMAFKIHVPSKQELFNYHMKQIEIMLWQDGMKLMTDVEPRLSISKNKKNYTIFVGAVPQKGHILTQTPQTLSQITSPKR